MEFQLKTCFLDHATTQESEDLFSRLLYRFNEYIKRNMSLTDRSDNDRAKWEPTCTQNTMMDNVDESETVASVQQRRRQLLSDGCHKFANVVNRSVVIITDF